MMTDTAQIRQQLADRIRGNDLVVAPGIYDPLGARVVQHLGFDALYMGGWITGAHLATTEPLLTMTEQVEAARRVVNAVDIPLVVDAGAGWGEPLHTMRTVREFEAAGVAGIHIEDQEFPKRAHYHRGIEHVCSRKEFLDKIEAALKARTSDDFLIIARTDAAKSVNADWKEAIWRCNAALEAGADMVKPLVRTNIAADHGMTCWEMLARMREGIPADAPVGCAGGYRPGQEDLTVSEYASRGYRMVFIAIPSAVAAAGAIHSLYRPLIEKGQLAQEGRIGFDIADYFQMRELVEEIIGLPEYYEVEERTVEPADGH